MTTRRPAPNFDFARAYAARPVAPQILFSADESDDDEPDQYDWSDDEDQIGDDSGQWESDVEQLAALAVTRASHVRHAMGSTLARTLERWR